MGERFDVIVVGARCAGSPLAIQLARAGLSVAVLDRVEFPSDTVSTHLFESGACESLARLGVLDAVSATGAPALRRADAVLGGVDLSSELDGEVLCVRRTTLDTILVDAARAAGAEVRTSTRVVGLLRDGPRVAGVVATAGRNSRPVELRAPLVVGADGRNSTVGRSVGARRYNVVPNERASFYGYFRDWRRDSPPRVHFYRNGEDVALALPTDGDLLLVIAAPPLHRSGAFRAGPDAAFEAYVRGFAPLDELLDGASRVGPLHGMRRFPGYFRESAGPGWALVGDAGHFKDPVSGQGIADALRQAELLAAAVTAGLGGRHLDAGLARWWRERDRSAAELYWFAADLQRCGQIPPIVAQMMRELAGTAAGRRQFWDCFLQRRTPSQVFTPARLARAVGALVGRSAPARGAAVVEVGGMLREEARRRRMVRHPRFDDAA